MIYWTIRGIPNATSDVRMSGSTTTCVHRKDSAPTEKLSYLGRHARTLEPVNPTSPASSRTLELACKSSGAELICRVQVDKPSEVRVALSTPIPRQKLQTFVNPRGFDTSRALRPSPQEGIHQVTCGLLVIFPVHHCHHGSLKGNRQ